MDIYVGNLPFSATEEEVAELFAPFGAVEKVKIVMDRETGRPRGFCFVTLADSSRVKEAADAVNGQELGGRPLRVNPAEPREPRPGGFGGGGGGGGGFGGAPREDRGFAPRPAFAPRGEGGGGAPRGDFAPRRDNDSFAPRKPAFSKPGAGAGAGAGKPFVPHDARKRPARPAR